MKVLFVGLGGVGQRHLRNLRTIVGPGLEVIAFRQRRLQQVVSPQLEIVPGKSLETEYGIQTYTNLDDALAQSPRFAVIANPTSGHLPISLEAAEAGCHLFIEKPVSHTYSGINELKNAVLKKQRKAVVAYQLRFHPCLIRLKEIIQNEELGQLLYVRAEIGEYLPAWHPYEDYRDMYAAREELGGGVVLSQIHELDYLYWLLGMPTRLFALGGHLSHLEIDVEDVASSLLEFYINGQVVPVHLHQDYVQRPPSRTCLIVGDQGKAVLDFRQISLTVCDEQGKIRETMTLESFDRNSMFLNEMNSFLAHLDGQKTTMASLDDGIESLRLALAIKESIRSRQPVEMSHFLKS